ncbi:unnamed protein product [Amoebophrya sp. A120]|nr:unnamed protein product [Amoebophrya sp. A120]|eukprot:GSA120T00016898001.1
MQGQIVSLFTLFTFTTTCQDHAFCAGNINYGSWIKASTHKSRRDYER